MNENAWNKYHCPDLTDFNSGIEAIAIKTVLKR